MKDVIAAEQIGDAETRQCVLRGKRFEPREHERDAVRLAIRDKRAQDLRGGEIHFDNARGFENEELDAEDEVRAFNRAVVAFADWRAAR